MLEVYNREYTLDNGKRVNIQIRYDDSENPQQRLQRGGFPTQTTTMPCYFNVPRKRLKPRSVMTTDMGNVIFRTHQAWLNFINDSNNRDKILSVKGEEYSCYVISIAVS